MRCNPGLPFRWTPHLCCEWTGSSKERSPMSDCCVWRSRSVQKYSLYPQTWPHRSFSRSMSCLVPASNRVSVRQLMKRWSQKKRSHQSKWPSIRRIDSSTSEAPFPQAMSWPFSNRAVFRQLPPILRSTVLSRIEPVLTLRGCYSEEVKAPEHKNKNIELFSYIRLSLILSENLHHMFQKSWNCRVVKWYSICTRNIHQ